LIRTLPLLVALALPAVGCKSQPAAPAPATAAIPADHNVDLNGKMHKPGMAEPDKNCASCHGANLDGGAASSCYQCHGKEW